MRTLRMVLACALLAVAASGAHAQTAAPPPSQPGAAPAAQPPATTSVQPVAPAAPAAAQPASAPPAAAPATPPPSAAEGQTVDQPVEVPSTTLETPVIQACNPSCRAGFQCVRGSCESVCNPPCVIGDVCTAQGDCIRQPTPIGADATPPQYEPGVHMHDGFFLRLTTGPAGGAVSLDVPDAKERTYSGGGWSSSLDIGGSVVRDLVLFGRLRGAWLFNPKVRDDDDTVDRRADHLVGGGLLGIGLNYYVMPINIYFGGAIGLASVTVARRRRGDEDVDQNSGAGFGIDLDAGKEWWVGDNWGIGVALRLSLASVPGGDDLPRDAVFGSGFVAVLFSATYQ